MLGRGVPLSVSMEPQDNSAHFSKLLVLAVAIFIAGSVASTVVDPYLPSVLSNSKKNYQDGFAAARKLVEESSLGNFFKTPDDVRTLSGTVTAVTSEKITMHLTSVNPFDDQSLNDRTVLITADTKIVRLVAKDIEVFQSEMAKFIATPQSISVPATFPQPYTQVIGNAQDIKAGELLTVTTSENVKTMKEFMASEIQVQENHQ